MPAWTRWGGASPTAVASELLAYLELALTPSTDPKCRRSRRFPLRADLVQLLLPLHVLSELHELVGLHEHCLFRAGIAAAAHVGHVAGDDVLDDRNQVGVDARMAGHVLFPEVEQIR